MDKHTFRISSGFVNITDPAYTVDTSTGAYHVLAKTGTWVVSTAKNKILSFAHQDYLDIQTGFWKMFSIDSNMFGLFDENIYEEELNPKTPSSFFTLCSVGVNGVNCIKEHGAFLKNSCYEGEYKGFGGWDNTHLVKFELHLVETTSQYTLNQESMKAALEKEKYTYCHVSCDDDDDYMYWNKKKTYSNNDSLYNDSLQKFERGLKLLGLDDSEVQKYMKELGFK